ncbi:MAG: hypothetical protein Q9161_001280 [Pseudevernia consocians]
MSTSTNSNPTSSHPPTSTPKNPHHQQQHQQQQQPPPILLALSGPTSSGKTTLATALHDIFPPPHYSLTTIHADDFYKPDSQIPLLRDGIQDWDCAESLDLAGLEGVLRGVKAGEGRGRGMMMMERQGNFEPDGDGDGDADGDEDEDGVHIARGISGACIERMRGKVRGWEEGVRGLGRGVVVVDGFLLFGKSVPGSLRGLFDVKVLLRAGYEDAKARRERRNGYVTLEGFWRDPEGYFERVVWPNYVGEYGGLVGVGEGEGGGGGGERREFEGQRVWLSDPRWGLEECLEWVIGVVGKEVERINRGMDEFGLDSDSMPG